ncbi:GNAT family N-acetyltransferase [Afifella sp. IM 167]|uniref:GNAT family N-acetyltransferase n=1 Tax=Afifella sp. IM 167 TaxID=2033586 RepID=UPI001CC9E99A|nr:N-acetyltransferase [Afifella sp. IM 167]MBZ8133869.1 GNAT family N-acetyltransferase [Afifella sp. IM 167]
MKIRETGSADFDAVLDIERRAFGREEEARLVVDLLADPTAAPCLSLLAEMDGRLVGHILFSAGRVEESELRCAVLAPLAVLPQFENKGCGGALIREGLERLRAAGTGLVFVLGHPGYYPRFGFSPAMPEGLLPPHPILPEFQDAWMVVALKDGLLGEVTGKVRCAQTLEQPELWREES